MFRRESGDLVGFAPGRVVLPQPTLGVQVLGEPFLRGEGAVFSVDREGAGTGGIDPDADDLGRGEAPFFRRLAECSDGGGLEAMQVVEGALAGNIVVLRIEQNALMPTGVGHDAGAEFLAVGTAHNERAGGVGAVIEAESEAHRR